MNFENVLFWKTIPTENVGVNGDTFIQYMEELKHYLNPQSIG